MKLEERRVWCVKNIPITIHFGPGEEFVLHRLEREKRHGTVELPDAQTYRFTADVYDASEMLPWLRAIGFEF